jgi:hypothetical protein
MRQNWFLFQDILVAFVCIFWENHKISESGQPEIKPNISKFIHFDK